jgi:hypothetical protein
MGADGKEERVGGRGEGELPLAYVGSRAGGDNRKRACSAQRRVGPKAQLTASAPAPGPRVRYIFELFYAFCMHIYLKSYYQVQNFRLCCQLS